MKKYTVIITPEAEGDMLAAVEYIRQRAPLNAARWLRGVYQTANKLADFAGQGRAPESDLLGHELRQVVFKSPRIVYSVDQTNDQVYVHYVRHGARWAVGQPPGND